jgi:amino acid transporter
MSTPLTNRKINLLQATSINMIDMVGIGPFVVMPFVVSQFNNGLFLWAWIFGAITAFVDAMIWSELGAAYPLAGGTYNFHRIAYGEKYGKLMSFLFVWQTSIQAPLVVASGAIGFSQYLTYIIELTPIQEKIISGSLVILVFLLLYRKIETIGKISVVMGSIVVLTILWIIVSGLMHQQHPVQLIPTGEASFFSYAFWAAVGHGSVKTVYSFLGYYNVCHLGGEIKKPEINIPRSIFISIIGIAVLYLLMNISIMGVIRWQSVLEDDKYLVSAFMESIYGYKAGCYCYCSDPLYCILFFVCGCTWLFKSALCSSSDGNFFKYFQSCIRQKTFLMFLLSFFVRLVLFLVCS